MSKPTFDVVIPLADDASITSDIHLRAMQDNLLTHAQFPNPQAWEYFREWLTKNTMEHIQQANKGVLIARDPATGDVASFVKWLEYGPGGEVSLLTPTATTTEDEWPEFCGRGILDEYTVIAAEARKRILKERGYFRKFLVSSPPILVSLVYNMHLSI